MRVLALDTTARAGSAALVEDGRLVDHRTGDASRTHAERLPGDLLGILADRGWPLASIDLFAVASGPGSFTGLRVGIATIQGLALVERRPVVAVSALEALAQAGSAGAAMGDHVGAWMDARRRDVFTALYRVGEGPRFSRDRLVEIEGASVGAPASVLARWADRTGGVPLIVAGDGAVLYRALLESEAPPGSRVVGDIPPLAATIGLMAAPLWREGGATTAAGIQPLYVRRPDAEVDREHRAAAAAGAGRPTSGS
ncbi:MAG: tRNA (adenosine(37)-N6)-threonylcarbamoyltransferase complex dimerization subunit type 1 TsaB [Acidobacteria bacterium]|nr:tRNA (adenosine(37)-N6)-threonylcarbamoyltransferase complex dimerization subunit type 1 TsaB [Acidobacteriota bacterium]